MIDSALAKTKPSNKVVHIIYAGDYYQKRSKLESLFSNKMNELSIQRMFVTKLSMQRLSVITKQKMKNLCAVKHQCVNFYEKLSESDHQNSVVFEDGTNSASEDNNFILNFDMNKEKTYRKSDLSMPYSCTEDLELFIEIFGAEFANRITENSAITYYMPRLTQNEQKRLEMKDENYLNTFYAYSLAQNPDLKQIEKSSSESTSRYALIECRRQTFLVNPKSRAVPCNFLLVHMICMYMICTCMIRIIIGAVG